LRHRFLRQARAWKDREQLGKITPSASCDSGVVTSVVTPDRHNALKKPERLEC
jgi:hypothetical protein